MDVKIVKLKEVPWQCIKNATKLGILLQTGAHTTQ
jgi:hypothetical protein